MRDEIGQDEELPTAERLVDTTVGRVIFNDILPQGMPFYNLALRSSDLARIIADCYQMLGRRETIDAAGRHEADRLPPGDAAAVCRSPPTT